LVVLDVQGNVLNAGTTAPHPFQMASWNYTAPNMGPLMWVATPRILYRLGARAVDIQQAGLGLSQGSGNSFAFDQTATNPLTGQPDGRLNHPIAAMSVTKPYGDVWLVLQDPGDPNATLLRMQPDSLVPTGIQLFATTAPVVSVLVDFQGNPRVATQRELIQFDGQNKTTFLSPYANAGRHILGMFQGFDFALWTAFDNPGQVVKLNP